MDVRIFALRMTGRLRVQFASDAMAAEVLLKCCRLNTAQTEHPCLIRFPRMSSYGICGVLWVSL